MNTEIFETILQERRKKLSMDEKSFMEIFKNYKDVNLTKTGFTVSFDSREHAMEAFKNLCEVLREVEKDLDAGVKDPTKE